MVAVGLAGVSDDREQVHIHNDTHMHFEYVRTTAQEVMDEVWIIKDHA